jgi:hypothetical protein
MAALLIALNKEPLVAVAPGPQNRFGSGEIHQEPLVKSTFAG